MNLPKTLAALAVATATFSLPQAFAASTFSLSEFDLQEKSREISIRGYDLGNVDDAKIVYGKIQSAAKKVCRVSGNHNTAREGYLRRQCERKAIAKAIKQLNAPVMTNLMNEDIGRS